MKVSVLMIAYNHERYIAQALDSILSQEIDFEYEIVIGEDCSTDGTRRILRAYEKNFPDKIRLLLREKNLGMIANFIQTFEACQGEYIAILEGDDYWTSPHKLHRQVHFLENHPECSECFHNVEVITEGAPEKNHLFFSNEMKSFYKLEDIAAGNFIPTCSTLLRSEQFNRFPDWFASMPMGDWPLHVLNAEKGSLGYLPEVLAAYRVHAGGVWSSSSRIDILEKSLYVISVINKHLNFRYNRTINKTMCNWEREELLLLLENHDYQHAFGFAIKSLMKHPRRQSSFFFKILLKKIAISLKQVISDKQKV